MLDEVVDEVEIIIELDEVDEVVLDVDALLHTMVDDDEVEAEMRDELDINEYLSSVIQQPVDITLLDELNILVEIIQYIALHLTEHLQ